jgi:putative sugar O-methyltransferase
MRIRREGAVLLKRVKYVGAKVKRAWADGTLGEKVGRFLSSSLRVPLEATIGYVTLPRVDRRLDVAAGFADHRARQDHHRSHPEHIRRIVAAYQAAKRAQVTAPPAFAIRGLWAEWLAVNYRDLIPALEREDTARLRALFENLQREQFTVGVGAGYDEYVRYRTSLTGRFYLRTVWSRYRDKLHLLGPFDGRITYPLIGNPAGIPLDGHIIPLHAFRHAYHALEMRQWLRDVPAATVVEIGGGIGGQAYQTLRMAGSIAKYLIFDIPEMAAVCSYFLLSAFPDRRARLFGEGPVSITPADDYDIAVFPHFEAARLPERSVDLFHNSCSFSEMDAVSAREYLKTVERACRRYFSHINHDVRLQYRHADGSTSVNIVGSELVPDPGRFKRIFKKPRVFCLPEDRPFPAFEYLYERIRDA